tara:strand:- start:2350 stop:2532 length:183 start_codon:yes stop_codon:yes gene_type:complete
MPYEWITEYQLILLIMTIGDLTDSTCLIAILNEVKPTECYNLAAQVNPTHPERDNFLSEY